MVPREWENQITILGYFSLIICFKGFSLIRLELVHSIFAMLFMLSLMTHFRLYP